SSDNKESLGEDASKHRRIDAIDADEETTLVSVHDMVVLEDVVEEYIVSTASIPVSAATIVNAATTTTVTNPKDKGKGILIEPMKHMKKKDLIRLDEEASLKLQAEFDEEERLAREKAEKEKEANIVLD
ncbi:hypothetical protein Tco_0338090, partial [Tanacetum coccineum]